MAEPTILVFDTEVKGKQGGVKGAKTKSQRSVIAHKLARLIDDAKSQRSELETRWDENESLYNLEDYTPAFEPFEDAARFNIPLMRSKLDTLNASVVTPIITSTPYFSARSYGKGAVLVDDAQRVVDWALDGANFPEKLREGARIASLTGKFIFRCWPDAVAKGFLAYAPDTQSKEQGDISFAGARLDVIHPRDFVIHPVTVPIERARLVGNRVPLRRQEIAEYRLASQWYCDDPALVESGDTTQSGKSEEFSKVTAIASEQEDEMIDVYFLLVKLDLNKDGTEEWYEIIFAYDSKSILDIAPYKWSRPWYVAPGYHTETGSFYNSGSPAQSIQGLAKAANELFNTFYNGTQMSAFPTTFFNRNGGYSEDAYLKIEPAAAIGVDGMPEFQQVSVGFNSREYPFMFNMIWDQADAVLRLNRMTGGQQLKAGTSATEAARLAEGQQTNQNDYLLALSGSICSIVDLILEYLYYHYDHVKEAYGDSFPCDDAEQLNVKCIWEVTGRSQAMTGPVITQRIMEFAGAVTTLGLADRLKPESVLEALSQYSGLPGGMNLALSEDEYAQKQAAIIEAQRQAQLMAQQQANGYEQQANFAGGGVGGLDPNQGVPAGFG